MTNQVDADAALSLFPSLCEPAQSFSDIADPWRHNLLCSLSAASMAAAGSLSRNQSCAMLPPHCAPGPALRRLGPALARTRTSIHHEHCQSNPTPTQTTYELCENLILGLRGIPPGVPKSLLDIPTNFTRSRLPGNKSGFFFLSLSFSLFTELFALQSPSLTPFLFLDTSRT